MMIDLEILLDKVSIHIGDLSSFAMENAKHFKLIAWDIETSGLDWKSDVIGTCQIYFPDSQVHIVQINNTTPSHLKELLNDSGICKLFHHAMFDLRFMVSYWSIEVHNVTCTKIASKILTPSMENHSLKNIIKKYLGITLDKMLQTSNWLESDLSKEQINYAVRDVIYLPELFKILKQKLLFKERWALAEACFSYLPVKAKLDILGIKDVFAY